MQILDYLLFIFGITNHLGNVLTVISDKKLPVCSEGTVQYYTADIVTATDYSPFGAPLPNRTYNVQETQNKTTLANQDFASGTDSWTATGSSTTVSNISGQLALTTSNTTTAVNMVKTYTVNTTKHYRFNLDVDAGTVANATISIIGVSGTLSTGTFTSASHQQIDFIADGGTVSIKIQMGIGTGTRVVYVDNVKLEEIKGDLSGYRAGFNGQEKDDEIAGTGNTMTAEFWEYDSRLGRRFNLDPKPHVSLSGYSVLENNPIFFTDPKGDTTYVYNTRGQYAFTILDTKNSNEIVFLNQGYVDYVMSKKGSWTENQRARVSRDPLIAYARFTEQSIRSLVAVGMSNSAIEGSGLLIANSKTKIIQIWKCKTCQSSSLPKGAAGSFRPGNINLEDVDIPGQIIGGWHDHNLKNDGYHESQPTFQAENAFGEIESNTDFTKGPMRNGGIGLINTISNITIYPLSDVTKNSDASPPSSSVTGNYSDLLNQERQGYTGSMQSDNSRRFGVYNKSTLGAKTTFEK